MNKMEQPLLDGIITLREETFPGNELTMISFIFRKIQELEKELEKVEAEVSPTL